MDQIGIAETVVNTLLIGTVAAIALAVGLAFGLGGQQTAAQLTQGWYTKGQAASQKVAHYAERQEAGSSGASQSGAPQPSQSEATTAPTEYPG